MCPAKEKFFYSSGQFKVWNSHSNSDNDISLSTTNCHKNVQMDMPAVWKLIHNLNLLQLRNIISSSSEFHIYHAIHF